MTRSSAAFAAPAVLAAALVAPLPAAASSDAAWEEFRAQVEAACRALTAEMEGEVTIAVNPFGSERFGAAIVSVAAEAGTDRMICIFEKSTGAAELTAPFGAAGG